MHSLKPIEQALLAFFAERTDVPSEFDADTDLLAWNLLDSLSVTDLLLHLESAFHVKLMARDVTPDNLRTVRRLTSLVAARQQRQGKAA